MINQLLNFVTNHDMEDIVVNELSKHRNEASTRKMLEQLTFRYAVVAKISITLRADGNEKLYTEYKRAYRRARDLNGQIDVIREVIRNTLGWNTTVTMDDIAFYKPAFDELFDVADKSVEYDSDDVESMVIEQNFKCGICGGDMTFDDAEGAHLFARVFFGHRLGPRNVYAAHKQCNCRQGISFVDVKYRPNKVRG
jgi:hypothetical protein